MFFLGQYCWKQAADSSSNWFKIYIDYKFLCDPTQHDKKWGPDLFPRGRAWALWLQAENKTNWDMRLIAGMQLAITANKQCINEIANYSVSFTTFYSRPVASIHGYLVSSGNYSSSDCCCPAIGQSVDESHNILLCETSPLHPSSRSLPVLCTSTSAEQGPPWCTSVWLYNHAGTGRSCSHILCRRMGPHTLWKWRLLLPLITWKPPWCSLWGVFLVHWSHPIG